MAGVLCFDGNCYELGNRVCVGLNGTARTNFQERKIICMSKRIESQVSRTAQMTLNMRAWSYYEKNKYYKSNDYIAPLIIPYLFRLLAKLNILGTIFKKFAPKGIYEYCIARTKLIDDIFKNSSEDIQQVLIFGAGFDSRAIRFKNELKQAMVFEFDAPITQHNKVNLFEEKNIEFPSNLKLISIDFNKGSLLCKLDEASFQKNMRCLFLLEGITMYLTQESIDSTFSLINQYAGNGSILVFDYVYASVIRQDNIYAGEEKLVQFVKKKGERFSFGIEKANVNDFLAKYNFELVSEFDSNRLAERFFSDEKGVHISPVNEIHSIVIAKKTGDA